MEPHTGRVLKPQDHVFLRALAGHLSDQNIDGHPGRMFRDSLSRITTDPMPDTDTGPFGPTRRRRPRYFSSKSTAAA